MPVRFVAILGFIVMVMAGTAGATTTEYASPLACMANAWDVQTTNVSPFRLEWGTRGVVGATTGSNMTAYCPLNANSSHNGTNVTAASFWVYQGNASSYIDGYFGCTDPGSSTVHVQGPHHTTSTGFNQVSFSGSDISALNSNCGSSYPLYMYFVWSETTVSGNSLTQYNWSY